MLRIFSFSALMVFCFACSPRVAEGIRKKDLNTDVEMLTSKGVMQIRLSDSTPIHRNNFLKLVKSGYYNGILFHRVIRGFMIQAGDPKTKASADTSLANFTIPAEFRKELFHRKGVIAAARMGDAVNPEKRSSGTQFYIVQGTRFTDKGLDSVSAFRMQGYVFPELHREAYKTVGGAPHLDQQYTVFGEIVKGLEVVDSIAAVKTSGRTGNDKPEEDVRIIRARLIKRSAGK